MQCPSLNEKRLLRTAWNSSSYTGRWPVTSLSIRRRMSPFSVLYHLRRALLSSLHLPVITILTISLRPVFSVGVLWPSQCVCLDFFILYILPWCIYYCSSMLFYFILSTISGFFVPITPALFCLAPSRTMCSSKTCGQIIFKFGNYI